MTNWWSESSCQLVHACRALPWANICVFTFWKRKCFEKPLVWLFSRFNLSWRSLFNDFVFSLIIKFFTLVNDTNKIFFEDSEFGILIEIRYLKNFAGLVLSDNLFAAHYPRFHDKLSLKSRSTNCFGFLAENCQLIASIKADFWLAWFDLISKANTVCFYFFF